MSEPLGHGMAEPPDRNGAFPRLDDEQCERLLAVGELREVASGEVLFEDGDDSYDFFVVASGAIAIVRGYGDENHVIAVHERGRFLGELNLLTGSRVSLTAVVRDAGAVIQVPRERLLELVAADLELSNLIIRAYLARRAILIDIGGGVRVVGSHYSPDTRRLREFLARNRVPYHWVDLESDAEADTMLRTMGVEPADTPVVVSGQGVLRNPSNTDAARMLGLGARGTPPPLCDLIVVGGGPAGLAAAVYGASEGRSAVRPAPRRGSRTTWAFRPASRAAS
jgi:thioredoxin reductase (NADPH)